MSPVLKGHKSTILTSRKRKGTWLQKKKKGKKVSVMIHFCNFDTQNAEEGECLSWSLPGLKSKTITRKRNLPPQKAVST